MSGWFHPARAMRTAITNLPFETLATEWCGATEAKRLREAMGETVEYVADVCGIPKVCVEGWESDEMFPTPEAVQCPPDWWQRHVFELFAIAARAEAEAKRADARGTDKGKAEPESQGK